MTTHALSPRRAMLAQAAALEAFLQHEFFELPEPGQLALALCEDPSTLKLDALEHAIDALKAKVLHAGRMAERHAFNDALKRPRGYRRPKVPAGLARLLDKEDPELVTSAQVLNNLEGALYVLDVVCAVYLRQVGAGSLIASAPVRPLLLTNEDQPLAWVLLPEQLDSKAARAACARLVKHVRKFDSSEFRERLLLSELVRKGFRVLAASPDSFDISQVA